ncbi:efflux RND transporter periplasmic adaptor subunit [Hymenobacter radiodurans]|uniref:efflux RND transporter periplasmic adaptor subunit n=1 Tax=Hymenobacter radiodurans TaxID=2496028 RepID=UPI001058DA3E|nr:efflux RND transporter periplasmic adaptor subunit [Hymenobacter radiodurans]
MSARAGGRVERLYVRYNYQRVQAGQRLLDLYSPELNTALREYQYLVAQGVDADLQQRSRAKLQLLGVSASQLASDSKNATPTLLIVSPYAGYVVPSQVAPAAAMPAAAGGMGATATDDGMGSAPAAPAAGATAPAAGSGLREGGYVAVGDPLFTINDLRQVWGILAVEARYVDRVRPGQRVRLRSELNPGQLIEARVAYIEPAFAPDQKFLQVRVYLDNAAGQLKVNSLLTGTLEAPAPRGLQLPASSVYDTGRRHLVWVHRGTTAAGRRLFEARTVTTGPLGGPMVAILAGLGPQEKVAREAGYLVDSESFLDPQTP